jgi:hypothetical protein
LEQGIFPKKPLREESLKVKERKEVWFVILTCFCFKANSKPMIASSYHPISTVFDPNYSVKIS